MPGADLVVHLLSGLATAMCHSHGTLYVAQAGAGTPAYMAPELLDGRSYNEKVDVYAFGVLLNELLTREVGGWSLGDAKAAHMVTVTASHRLVQPTAMN